MAYRPTCLVSLALAMVTVSVPATADDKSSLLAAHNSYRTNHCAPALSWSARLAESATAWAKKCSFNHAAGNFGENLVMGGGITAKAAVRLWHNEVAKYSYSKASYSAATGHFTQVVWKSTTRLGCGKAMCGGNVYWVCRYYPPGNYAGQFKENVLKPGC